VADLNPEFGGAVDCTQTCGSLAPNDAKAIVGILLGNALNQPGQHFAIGCLRETTRTWESRYGLAVRALRLVGGKSAFSSAETVL
jgi:hypothetical protein